MSSPTPQSPRFADQPVNADHRLKSGTVVMIVVACIVAAVAATAAVVFTGPEQVNEPPTGIEINPPSKPQAAAPQDALVDVTPKPRFEGVQGFTSGAGTLPFPKRPPIGGVPLAGFEFGNGLALQIPDGWDTIEEADQSLLIGIKESGSVAVCHIQVGEVKVRDITKVLQTDLKEMAKQMENFQANTENSEVQELDGTNFTQIIIATYSGDVSGQQGTTSIVGMAIELFNPETGMSAFLDYFSPDLDLLKAKASDIDTMIASML